MCARLEEAHTKPTYTQRDDSPLEDAGRLCRISPDATDKFTVKEEAFTVPNLPDHLVPEEFAGNEWFVEEQYERYQQDKNLVDPSWWPIFQSIDKALQGTPTARGCVVISGILNDPYTGKVINFMRGKDTSEQVQIDHVVALSDAWQSGAQEISAQERLQLANDPENLLAVDGPANQQKSDSDAATWLPANASFRCSYVARQIRVKAKYHLWVKPAEKEAMINVLTPCTGAAAKPAPVPQVDAPPAQNPAPALAFQTCADARAAGYRNMHRGAPGYSEHLDRDGDGIACEAR